MKTELSFEEKQFLGLNKYSLMRRAVIALFFFMACFFTPDSSLFGGMYLYMGLVMILMSILLFFILHFKTTVAGGSVVLDGLWTTRKVKIDLSVIDSVEQVEYNPVFLKNSVYNLHRKGRISFFTRGIDAVLLIDKDGLEYIIGSQQASDLYDAIQNEIKKIKS